MTKIGHKFLTALLNGDVSARKPRAITIKRVTAKTIRVSIANAKGEDLVLLAECNVDVGSSMSLTDIHRAFEITLLP